MQQYCVVCVRESSGPLYLHFFFSILTAADLLYLHRGYFAKAIREAPCDPLQHKYAPSVLATYRSACRLISSLKGVYPHHPEITSRVWFFWAGVFSSCVSVCCYFGLLIFADCTSCIGSRESWMYSCKERTPALGRQFIFLRRRFASMPAKKHTGMLVLSGGGVLIQRQTTLQKLCTRAQTAFAAYQSQTETPMTSDPDGRKSIITVSRSAPQLSSRNTPEMEDALMDLQYSSVGYQQPVGDRFSTFWHPESHADSLLRALSAVPPPPIAMEPSQDDIWSNFMREFGLES